MEFSPHELARFTVQAVILGGFLGAFYDVLKMIRLLIGGEGKKIPYPKCFMRRGTGGGEYVRPAKKQTRFTLGTLIFFEDVLFCVASTIAMLLLAFVGNKGQIRWFLPIGMGVGFCLYRLTLGKILAPIWNRIAAILRILLAYTFWGITLPFRLVAGWTFFFLSTLMRALQNRISLSKAKRYTQSEKKRLLSEAESGFSCMRELEISLPSKENES